TDYVETKYIRKKVISADLAYNLLSQAEKYIGKATNKVQKYNVYMQLYTLNVDLKNTGRANSYKKKAALLNVELGDLQRQEIERINLAMQQQKGMIAEQQGIVQQLGQENFAKDSVISETTAQLYLEKIERENKEAQLKAVQQEKDIQTLQLQRRKTLNTIYALIIALFAVITSGVIYLFVDKRKKGQILAEQNRLLAIEKKRSDDLLLNILPAELAEELKMNGQSEARSHEAVTVMFTDFVDFSRMSEMMTAQELVHEIDYCFKAFDRIISKYQIEKIKTVGDAYLCACGVPRADLNHAENVINAALDVRDFMTQLAEDRATTGQQSFKIRIGIHSGPLVAGIVGIRKFAYDIWGDTVNIASRMESSSEANKVNVSESTYHLAKDKYYFISRGKIEAKNKGMIDMYFVERNL
ncbi:MAG TPA: adenylate/guanylate cyclase domain-containing protein, partial [Saprospiraceae bacterium]|nr:adenylate/guanylate cyclase domain-containing protein [Saprospiraceae bacterium]